MIFRQAKWAGLAVGILLRNQLEKNGSVEKQQGLR
jgi:hypothetical protein